MEDRVNLECFSQQWFCSLINGLGSLKSKSCRFMTRWKHAILPHEICLLNLQSNFPTVTPCSQAAHILLEYFSHCILYWLAFFSHITFCSVHSVNIKYPQNMITPFFPYTVSCIIYNLCIIHIFYTFATVFLFSRSNNV